MNDVFKLTCSQCKDETTVTMWNAFNGNTFFSTYPTGSLRILPPVSSSFCCKADFVIELLGTFEELTSTKQKPNKHQTSSSVELPAVEKIEEKEYANTTKRQHLQALSRYHGISEREILDYLFSYSSIATIRRSIFKDEVRKIKELYALKNMYGLN